MDPEHPGTLHLKQVVAEIWAGYVRTHSLAECGEAARGVGQQCQLRRRLYGRPQPQDP